MIRRRTMLRLATACAMLASLPHARAAVDETRDLMTVHGRLREPLANGRVHAAEARNWLAAIGDDGRWKDVDYSIVPERQKAYAPADHQHRCRAIALMLARGEAKPEETLPRLSKALDVNLSYRHEPRFTWANDWYATHISVPGTYAETLLMLDGILPRGELLRFSKHLRDGLSVPRANGQPFQFSDAGQNLQWVARVSLVKAAIERDAALMHRAFEVVSSTISYQRDGPEGIKVDGMFHQHGRQVYNGGYGLWYVGDMIKWFELSRGTSFAREFKADQLAIFRHMLLSGHQWVAFRGFMDMGTRGRNVARTNDGRGVADWALEVMAGFDKRHAQAYQDWIDHNRGGPFTSPGNRHFWKSDMMIHRGADWYLSAKMLSTRTVGTETMNGENLLGHNLPLGAVFVKTRGPEYFNIQPLWDWSLIPGTTATLGVDLPSPHVFEGKNPFCGGASDGASGILAFQAEYQGVARSQAVIGFGSAFVCLTAGIRGNHANPVATSINQCFLNGPVTIDGSPLAKPSFAGKPRWIHHDSVGYVILEPENAVEVRAGERTGSWRRVAQNEKPDPVKGRLFSAWIDHGPKPRDARTAYVILPRTEASAMDNLSENHGIRVLRNDADAQAVLHEETGQLAAVFYRRARIDVATGIFLSVEEPAIVLVSNHGGRQRVFVGDPLQNAGRIAINLSGRRLTAVMETGDLLGRCVEALPGSGRRS